MSTVQDRLHDFRQYLHRQAGERVWSVGGALRVHLNNFSVDALRDYIALSRHQFELIEFVTQRTGMDTGEPVKFEVMNWSTGKPDIWIDRGKPRTDEVPEWELEMLEDMAWRAQAMGHSLSRFEQNMTISAPADLMELSRHQCEMLNFIKTGSFRKVPGKRKARTISGGGSTPQSEERIKILGEALKEYQGRIEIRTVREFIALSKHQCELAGLLFAEHESGQPVFEVVDYRDAYPNAVGRSPLFGKVVGDSYREGPGEISSVIEKRPNPPQSPFSKGGSNNPSCSDSILQTAGQVGASRDFSRQKTTTLDTPVKVVGDSARPEYDPAKAGQAPERRYGVGSSGPVGKRPSTARMRGDSASPGVPFCDTFGHSKVSKENNSAGSGFNLSFPGLTGESRVISRSEKTTALDTPVRPEYDGQKHGHKNPHYESVPLDPDTHYDLPRVPMLEGNMIPLPTDGRWVRVETPDGPMAMRSLHTKEPDYYEEEDVWDDDYRDHASGVAGDWEDDYWNEDWEEP